MGILSIAICFFKHRSVSRSKHFFIRACVFFFFNQKTAYEVRISDWSSDVCSSDLELSEDALTGEPGRRAAVAEVAAGTVVATVATTSRPRSGGTKRAPARKKAAPPPSLLERFVRALGTALDGHWADVAGLISIALGIVAAMGIYADAAGPAGSGLDSLIGTAIGWGRLLAPVALVVGGVLLVRGTPDDAEEPVNTSHVWVGGLLVAVAGAGLLHLAGERKSTRLN